MREPEIKKKPVQSRTIKSVGYDPEFKILEVEFRNGGVYRYFDVAPSIYRSFLESPSKGHFFQEKIRDEYDYQRSGEKMVHEKHMH